MRSCQKRKIWTYCSFCVTSRMKTRQAFADLYCSQELTQDLDKQIISLSVINTLLAISAIVGNDLMLIALRKKKKKQHIFLRRVYILGIALWVLVGMDSAILAMLNPIVTGIVSVTGSIMCLITAFLCYTRIFFRLRHQQTQVHNNLPEQQNQTIPVNSSRYRKTVYTALWLQLAFVFCYFPYILIVSFARRDIEKTHSSPLYFPLYSTITLLFFNSTLNPILYCWKIKEVRRTVKNMFSCS